MRLFKSVVGLKLEDFRDTGVSLDGIQREEKKDGKIIWYYNYSPISYFLEKCEDIDVASFLAGFNISKGYRLEIILIWQKIQDKLKAHQEKQKIILKEIRRTK